MILASSHEGARPEVLLTLLYLVVHIGLIVWAIPPS